jgi:hypothetical protein
MDGFIDALSPEAEKRITAYNKQVIELIGNIGKASSVQVGGKTPSQTDSAIKSLNDQLIKQDEIIKKLQKDYLSLAETEEKVSRSKKTQTQIILDQAKSYQGLAAQKEKAIAQSDKEEQLLLKANSLYSQTQQKVNQLTAVYNDLAIKKELGGKLTNSEILQLSKLTSELNIYQSALIKVDKDIQKNGRNVGNYASGWNGLGNSINQLSREMPAFANSVQTGFMALSNNLPILFDEISRVKNANKELIAQGQPIKSTFMQIAGAIFSWQTLLSVGVTVLTLYGAKIWESVSGSKAKKEALEKEKKAIEDKVEAEKNQNEVIGQSIAAEQNRARILFEIAKNNEVSDKKRNEALKELRDRYGKYLTDLTNEEILAGKTAEQEERLNEALIGRGYALATQNLLEKNATEQMALQVEYQKTLSSSFKDLQKLRNNDGSIKNEKEYYKILRQSGLANNEALKILNEKLKPLKSEEEALLQLFRGNAKYLDVVTEKGKVEKKNAKEKELFDENSQTALENQIKVLTEMQGKVDESSYAYSLLDFQIKLLSNTLKGMKGEFAGVNDEIKELNEGIMLTDEQVYYEYFAWLKLKDATDAYIKSISSGAIEKALDSIGFSSAKMFLDFDENGMSTFNKLIEGANTMEEKFAIGFQAIGDLFQDTLNFMAQGSANYFANKREELKQDTEIALAFAGDSETAQQEIKRQAQEKEAEIRRKEFNAKKQQAKTNILIDIAQAVAASVAQSPLTFGLPFSAIATAIGLAQLAVVNSQQPPQFYKGTENAPQGWAWTQEKGQELILDKNNKVKSYGNNKGAQLTKLDAGDKVKTAEETKRILSSSLIFDNQLNNIMANNGISSPIIVQNNGQGITDAQISKLSKVIESIPQPIITMDKNGWKSSVRNGHTTKEILNNHVTFGR